MANTESKLIKAMKKIFNYLDTGANSNQIQKLNRKFLTIFDKITSKNFTNNSKGNIVNFFLLCLKIIKNETHSTKLPFDGLLYTQIDSIDSENNFHDFATDPFVVVPIALSTFSDLEESLRDFTKKNFMAKEAGNPWKTSNGEEIDVTVILLLQDMPLFLLFQLQRFDFVDYKNVKISNNFLCPDSIDMSPFMISATPCKYKLAGMLCQQGNADGGHYLTYIRNEDGESFVQLDSAYGAIVTTISKEDFMRHDDCTKNSCLVLYARIK
ncbi:MAG: ubiquitin carboxyl-terminal hydrolase [Puniceicoccales bacterium]|nr:ubiquitin carboxyl-terminal hydrolase [Puniceicoccales bacterium]